MSAIKANGHVVSFLSLEDFAEDVVAADDLVRVDVIERLVPNGALEWVQWWVVATARMVVDGMAMASILIGDTARVFIRDELHHPMNAQRAAGLVRQYLEGQGFVTAPGVWNLSAVVTNLVAGRTWLWRFEGKKLVTTEEDIG